MTIASCMGPEIWNDVPAAVVQGRTTQEPPDEAWPIRVTFLEFLKAAGTRLPQEKELGEIMQYSLYSPVPTVSEFSPEREISPSKLMSAL